MQIKFLERNMSDQLLPDIIAPEGLEVAEAYLELGGDTKQTSKQLGLPVAEVEAQLKKPEVKGYVNRIFNEQGFRNRNRIFGVMDQLLNMKLEEIQETGVGTSMDIVDVIKFYHKMKMDEMKMEMEIDKNKTSTPTTQTNVQNNFNLPGADDENYTALMSRLSGGNL